MQKYFHYTLCFFSWLVTYYKSQITLAGKIRSGGDTLCYSWFEFKFEQFDHLEIRISCSALFDSIIKHLMYLPVMLYIQWN